MPQTKSQIGGVVRRRAVNRDFAAGKVDFGGRVGVAGRCQYIMF